MTGLASNLALTVPLALIVLVGSLSPLLESWVFPLPPQAGLERRPADRERARRARAAKRLNAARAARAAREAPTPHKERNRSA